MRTTYRKLFWIWELPKEEAWINEMAGHGYGLVAAGKITFEFEDINPGQYKYKELFMKDSFQSAKMRDFLRFMEEMGIENVGHVSYPGHTVIYLRYENNGTEPEIYSDLDSRIEYEKTLVRYIIPLAIINILAWLYNMAVMIICIKNGTPNFIGLISLINLGIAVAIFIHTGKKLQKIKALEQERTIHE
ncbi:MAG: DUF2812 domain-containing protein [Lachnospiraceae bacterium]|nr:DUF2812 domain-containing protein [Lachnospiraceae bacterium]